MLVEGLVEGRAEGRGIAGDPQATAKVSRPAGRRRRARAPSSLPPSLPLLGGGTVDAGTLVTHTNLALRYVRYHQGAFGGKWGGAPGFGGVFERPGGGSA